MRVVGGSARGRRLAARVPKGVRPTSDRVREAVFDILGSMTPLSGLRVVDLFAGTGALGIEALSRGAASVTFVERDPGALGAVRANLQATGLAGPAAQVVGSDVIAYLEGPGSEAPFDLALCDPPYRFERWDALLGSLRADLAVLESGDPLDSPERWPGGWPERWMILRSRRYGGTLVTVVGAGAESQEGSGAESQGGSG